MKFHHCRGYADKPTDCELEYPSFKNADKYSGWATCTFWWIFFLGLACLILGPTVVLKIVINAANTVLSNKDNEEHVE
tara:strand:- start:41 stop:274 length:234 start_codon:yes stop_codon:yes gene_type:complete